MTISIGVDATKLIGTPSSKRRPLVIDKDAAIFHLRFSVGISTRNYIYFVVSRNRCIRHPIPWRHTNLTRQFIDTKNGTTLVGSQDNQLPLIRKNEIFLPLSFQLLALLGISFRQLTLTHSCHDDRSLVASRYGTKVIA